MLSDPNEFLGIQNHENFSFDPQEVAGLADPELDDVFTGLVMKRLLTGWMVLVLCLALPAWAAKPAAGGACLVAEFKTLSLSLDDVQIRSQQARAWLQQNISRCTSEQLSAIKSNSPSWLGHALTPQLAGLIEGAIEAKISGNPALMGQLYESLGKEGKSSVETLKNPTPRAPVVRPMDIHGGLAGSVNYGNITGPSTSIVNQSSSQNSNQNQNTNQNAVQSPNASQVNPAGLSNNQNALQLQGQSGQIMPR